MNVFPRIYTYRVNSYTSLRRGGGGGGDKAQIATSLGRYAGREAGERHS